MYNLFQVYIVQVKWSDRTEYVIYRAYSEFYDFHVSMNVVQDLGGSF